MTSIQDIDWTGTTVATQPARSQIHQIIVETGELERNVDKSRGMPTYRFACKIPYVIADLRVTIDESKVSELHATCRYEDRYVEYDDPRVCPVKYGFTYSETPREREHDLCGDYMSMQIRQTVEEVYETLQSGFVSEPITVEVEEHVPPDLDPCVDTDSDVLLSNQELETRTVSHRVGTRRLGLDGMLVRE